MQASSTQRNGQTRQGWLARADCQGIATLMCICTGSKDTDIDSLAARLAVEDSGTLRSFSMLVSGDLCSWRSRCIIHGTAKTSWQSCRSTQQVHGCCRFLSHLTLVGRRWTFDAPGQDVVATLCIALAPSPVTCVAFSCSAGAWALASWGILA